MSECQSLVLVKERRPSEVRVNAFGGGMLGTINIAAHDEWYLRRRSWFKAQLRKYHPDLIWRYRRDPNKADADVMGKASTRFYLAQKRYTKFLEREKLWYNLFGLKPPKRQNETGRGESTIFIRTDLSTPWVRYTKAGN